MTIAFVAEAPPLCEDETGVLRVGQTRVLLDLVIHAFQNGETPESIVQSYDSLNLADVYGVIAYYLHHREEIDDYLAQRETRAAEIRREIESTQGDMSGFRERLLKRWAELEG